LPAMDKNHFKSKRQSDKAVKSFCVSFHPSSFILHPFLFTLSLCLSATLFFSGCSSAVKPQTPQDTVKDHYQAGMKLIGTKDAAKADAEFLRAVELDKKSPLGYAGMAALEMSRSNYKNVITYANNALRCDRKFTEAGIIKGRAIMARGRKNWPQAAKSAFQNVLDVDPQNKGALFYLGEACLYSFQFKEAQGYYAQRAELKDSLATSAVDRIKLTIRILALNQISDSDKLIALSEKATRSEICQLLLDELKLKDLLRIHRLPLFESAFSEGVAKRKIPPDIRGRSDRRTILDITSLHMPDMDVYPNGNFYPLRTVNRAEFALMVQDIMVLLNDDQTLATKYSDSESDFPDIRPDYFAFNAIMISFNEGIMKPDPDTGRFNTDNPVSGIDAIEMIRALGGMYSQ
jgi:tetratricopeptide (TPR) repeat protein